MPQTKQTMEKILQTIWLQDINNTQNVSKMANLSTKLITATTNGEKLANKTTQAMEDINTQVNSIAWWC